MIASEPAPVSIVKPLNTLRREEIIVASMSAVESPLIGHWLTERFLQITSVDHFSSIDRPFIEASSLFS
jgi:hypothetical protein